MPTTKTRRTTPTARGLGWRHQQAVAGLKRCHRDGSPCDWCGRPLYLDRTRNWDYKPDSTNPNSGKLHADHSKMSRAEAIRRGLPIAPPDRLLHGACNIQRGEGGNDHLAASARGRTAAKMAPSKTGICTDELKLPWPW
jgi:hypothetical protein